jgi:leader peptidase (prepilin peptidase)/N-methyltransferase
VAAALAAGSVVRFGWSADAAVGAFFVCVLVAVSLVDLERRIIPNRIVLPATAVILAAQIGLHPERTAEWLLATVGAGLFLLLPLLVNPAMMGMGDVKLAALLGAALGGSVLVALAVGIGVAALVALAILARAGLGARRKAIAYGPFLALGGVVGLFFGERLLAAYFG